MNQESEELVKVCIRIRPEYENSTCIEKIDDKNLKLIVPELTTRRATSDIKVYSFDKIYDGMSSQSDIYKTVSENVAACTRGYNTTIFAYGCTGSGKSYTMAGTDSQPGIIPRALEQIFSIIETRTAEDHDIFFYVRMSYVELYNNNFRNLLESAGITKNIVKDLRDTYYEEEFSPISGSTDEMRSPLRSSHSMSPLYSSSGKRDNKIEVREDKTTGVFLAGPNLRVPVTNQKEAYEMYRLADKHRSIGTTQCNDMSSRSHAILTLHVESRTPNALHPGLDDDLRLGKMHLIDLAGSERLSMSGAEGETLVETQNINLSLTTLGDVISALTKNASTMAELMKSNPTIPWHKKSTKNKLMSGVNLATGAPSLVPVPYRNSKLTHLLKDSLGGNSKTLMITTIRPTEEYYQQTAMSLMYASRAKKIRNQLLVNKSVLGDTGIHAVNSELQRLKKRLEDRSNEFERLRVLHLKDTHENSSLKSRLQELQAANEAEKVELENQLSHIIHNQAGQLVNQKERISSLQKSLQEEIQVSQNRIAEQEKEIKWLKRALEDKTQAALKPVEELERMKQVMFELQNQASNARDEVVVVLSQAEKLKSQNEALQKELNEVKSTLNSVQNKHSLESQEMKREFKELNDSNSDMKRQLDEAIKTRDKAVSQCEEIGNQLSYTSSTAQKLSTQQLEMQEKNAKSLLRINELEREKNELQIKLTDLLADIENRTTLALNGANERIKSLQSKLNVEEEKAIKGARDVKSLKEKLAKLQEDSDTSNKSRDELILKLKESIISEEEKSAELKRQIIKKDESLEKAKKTCSDLATELQKAEKRVAEKVKTDHNENETLIREHQRKIKEIQDQNIFLIAKAANETKEEYELQLKALKKELKQRDDKLGAQIAEYESKIDKINRDNAEKLFEIELSSKEKIKDIETKHASAINELSVYHRNHTDSSIKSQRKEIEKKREVDIQNMKKDADVKLAEAQVKFQAMLQNITNEKEALEQKYKDDMSYRDEIEKDLKSNIDDYISQLKKSGDDTTSQRKELQDMRKELQTVKAEYKEYKSMSEKSIKLEREEMHERHRLQILNLEHEHETNLQEYLKNIEINEMKHKQTIAETISSKDKEIIQLISSKEKELRSDYEKEINNLKEVHKLNLEKQKRELADKLDNELLKMLSSQEHSLLQEHEKNINLLEAQYSNDLQQAKQVYDRQLEELMDAQERSLNAKYDAYHKQEEIRWNKVVRELNDKHEVELGDMENALKNLENNYKQEIESIKDSHEKNLESLQSTREKTIDTVKADHKLELETINANHIKELESLKSNLETDMVALRQAASQALAGQDSAISKLNDLQKRELELSEKHSQDIKNLTISHRDELERAKNEFEMRLYNDVNNAQNTATDNLKAQHNQELESIKQDHIKELERQKAFFDEKAEKSVAEALLAREAELLGNHEIEMKALENKLNLEISNLMTQLTENESKHKKELDKALKDQHDELFSRHVSEMENLHSEKRQIQLKHQSELTEASQSKIEALNAQRIQLETVHSQLVDSLSKELTSAQDRYRSTITAAASKQGEEAKIMLEQQLEFSNTLQTKLSERDSQHQQALSLLRESLQKEVETSKSSYDQELKKVNELSIKLTEKENKELEMARTVTLLTENVESLNITVCQLKEELVVTDKKLRDELAMKLANEIERHREELKHVNNQFEEDIALKDSEIAELEATVVFRNDENEKLTSSLSSLSEKNEQLQKEIEAINANFVNKEQEMTALLLSKDSEIQTITNDSNVIKLKADLDAWIERCTNAEKLNTELENEKKIIESDFEKTKETALNLQIEIDQVLSNERKHEQSVEDTLALRTSWWENEKALLNEKIDDLTAQLADKISASLEDASKYSELLESKGSLEKQVHDLTTNVEQLEATLSQQDDDNNTTNTNTSNITKVPIRVLSSVNDDYERKTPQRNVSTKTKDISGGKPATPWSVSPKKLSSPTDQLISAILDGDVQGIRAVVRTMGEDFTAPYWKDKIIKLLPLHRAVSALHFHGNRKLLVSSLESLIQLGANVNGKDSSGNTALHKVIQTCTSKSVTSAVQALLNRGASPNIANNNGDVPLYIECCNLRTASTDVVSLLLGAGANPNIIINGFTPLSKILSSGIQVSAAELDNEKENLDNSIDEELRVADSMLYATSSSFSIADINISDYFDKMRLSATRTWLRVINVLVTSNATWDKTYRDSNKSTQLHLLLSNFPPSIIEKDFNLFMNILTSCLDEGTSINTPDGKGNTCLFTVCERLQQMPVSVCPNAELILRLLLRYSNGPIDAYLNTKNHNNISINDMLNNDTNSNRQKSCLSKCRQFLLNYIKDNDDNNSSSLDISRTPQSNKKINDTSTNHKNRSRNKNKKNIKDDDDIIAANITLEFTPDTNIITNSNSINNSINMQSIGKGMTMSDILSDTKIDNKINSSTTSTPIAASPLFRTAIMYSKNKKYTSSNTSTFLVESDED